MTAELRSAEVIAVGSELLGSARLDTNSLFISSTLAALGIPLKAKAVVGDDRTLLTDLFALAIARTDLVVVTGGLGPTDDDLTREAVVDALGIHMSEDEAITTRIRERFARRGMTMPELNRKQAMVPEGATVLDNPNGSAPGLFIPVGEKIAILLPGPPRELQPMLSALCQPSGSLAARAGRARLHSVSVFTTGLSESHVEELAQPLYAPWRDGPEQIDTTILATPGQVELHLTLRSADATGATMILERARGELVNALGQSAFSTDGRNLPQVVGELLQTRGLTFAAAESCTGGLLMTRMTDVAGSSSYVRGGVVSYSNDLKVQMLGVDPATLAAHGAVSEQTAAAMVDGLHEKTRADVCVAITGIAGPAGGTDGKPVGTVVIATRISGHPLSVRTHLFAGGRDLVRFQATQAAIEAVRRIVIAAPAARS